MQDPFAPFDPVKAGVVPRTQGQQDFDRRLIEAFTPKSKPKAKAKGDVLEEALRLPKGSLLPPGQENKPRKENRQRLSKTWKALEGRGLSAQDLELAQSIVFMSMKDRDGNELSPVEGERNLAEFKPTITEKEALDILRDPLKRAEAEGQRKAWREMRKISTAQKEGKPWQPTSTEPGFVPGKEQDAEGQSMTRSHRLQKAFEKGIAPGLLTPGVWQDIRDELSHRSGKWYAENGPLALGIKLTGGDPSKNEANVWVGGLVGNLIGGTLDPMAALEFAADDKKPGFDRLAAAAQAAIGMVGAGQAVNSVNDVMRLVPNLGKKAGLPPEALKETAQAILDDLRANTPKADTPPPIPKEIGLHAQNAQPPVKGIPDEPRSVPETVLPPDEPIPPVVVQQDPQEVPVAQPPSGVKEPWQMTRDEYSALHAPDADTKKVLARAEKVAGVLQDLGWDLERGAQIPRSSWAQIAKKAGIKNPYEFSGPDAQGLKVIDLGNGYVGIKREGTRANAWHYTEIEQALSEGKPVPPEVLADYPDLKPVDTPAQASTTVEPPITPEAPQNAVETPSVPRTPVHYTMGVSNDTLAKLVPFSDEYPTANTPKVYGQHSFHELLSYVGTRIERNDVGTVRTTPVDSYFDGTGTVKTSGKTAIEIFPANGKDGRRFIVDKDDATRLVRAIERSYANATTAQAGQQAFKITNMESLPRGTGAKFIVGIKGEGDTLVAKRWARSADTKLTGTEVLVDLNGNLFQPQKIKQATTVIKAASQNAIETPKITLDDARQIEDPKARREALKQAWASRAQEAAQGKEGSLASGVDPDFLRYVYDVGKTYVEEGLADFAAWSKAMLADLGDEIKPHLEKAWATVKPNKDFGLAAQYEPEGRAASGFLNVEDLAKRGEELVTSGQIVPENVYKKAVYDGHVTPDEIAAIAYRGKFIENRTAVVEQELASGALDDAELGARMAELSVLQSEMGSVLEVGDVAQKTFHQTGQALQVAFSPNYTPVRVRAMAKAYNYGEELDPKIANRLDTLTNSLTEAKGRISKLESDLEKALKDRATRAGGTRSADPATKKAALLRAINSDLGLDKYTVTAPGIRGKTTGAVSVPKNKQKAMAGYVNSLTKLYIEEGASTLDEVVKRFQGDMPLLSRDDVLGLLNKEYREATLEADVHKLEIDRALRMVQDQAKRARTSVGKRLVNEAGDGVISLQRQMQAGLDASLSFIQGFGGGQVSPSSWGKAWVPWFRVMKEGQTGVAKVNAQLHADPGFKFARKMGVGFSDASGSLGMQEEVLLGHLTQKARESKVPVVRQYFEFLARSQEAGTAFLNKLRLELFKKFVAGNWKDEQSMRDAAMLTNILTGRGSGAMADALSAKPFGYIAYAPRYTWSKYQNAALPLLLPTKITSKAGRTAAASAWTKQTAFALAVPYIAQSLGIEVDLDMHSSQFGAITLPNGGTLRLFKHFTEPVQTLFQISQGRTSKSGNFTPPGYMSSQIVGQYLTGKGSPMFSTGYRQLTNNRYDPALGEGVEFNLAKNPDDWKVSAYELFTPLSVQNAIESAKEGDVLGAFLSMMGIEYSPSKGTETTASGRR